MLVPRPETELLIEWGIELLKEKDSPRIAEVGTGSGCIAIALAKELPTCTVDATDISESALAIANENVKRHHLEARVHLHHGDLVDPLKGKPKYDLLVSNPPYIAKGDPRLEENVASHEPAEALYDPEGGDGLGFYRRLADVSEQMLAEGGVGLVELPEDGAEAAREFLKARFASPFPCLFLGLLDCDLSFLSFPHFRLQSHFNLLGYIRFFSSFPLSHLCLLQQHFDPGAALEMIEPLVGPDHLSMAILCNNLGGLYIRERDIKPCREIMQPALESIALSIAVGVRIAVAAVKAAITIGEIRHIVIRHRIVFTIRVKDAHLGNARASGFAGRTELRPAGSATLKENQQVFRFSIECRHTVL